MTKEVTRKRGLVLFTGAGVLITLLIVTTVINKGNKGCYSSTDTVYKVDSLNSTSTVIPATGKIRTVTEKKAFCDSNVAEWSKNYSSLTPLDCTQMKDTCGVSSCEASIDLIYLWVNGSEPQFIAKKNETLHSLEATGESKQYNKYAWEQATSDGRFRDFGELQYSLRSVDMYAPWARRIFLVTDNQVPSFIDPAESLRIRMVSHDDLFNYMNITDKPKHPLYSSTAIQSMVHSIPALSSPFMMVDDDMMFGRRVPKSYLYDEVQDKYKIKVQAKQVGKNPVHPYISMLWSSFDMYADKYPNDTLVDSVLHADKIITFPWHEHGPILLFPEYGHQMWKDFPDRLTLQLHAPLRNSRSILMQSLYQLYAGDRYITEVPTADEFINYRLQTKSYSKTMDQMILALPRPYTLCLNDDVISDDPEFINNVSKYVTARMDQMYPEKV